MKKEEIITQFMLAGFTLITLLGKRPKMENWTNKQPHETDVDSDTKGNFGVVLTDTDIVIDVDPRNFLKDENPFEKILAYFPKGFSTLQVKTGDGGCHIYLKKPSDVKTNEHIKGLNGIDFLSKGRQVVAPSSIHPDTGKEYRIMKGTPFEIAQIPETLLDLIKKIDVETKAPIKKTNKDQRVYDDSDENKARFETYLKSASVAIEGQSGDHTTYVTAAMGKDHGLSALATFECLWKDWNWRCIPVWTYEELWGKVCNAYKYTKEEQAYYMAKIFDSLDLDVAKERNWILNNKTKQILPKLINLVNIFNGYEKNFRNLFRYNELTNKVEFQRVPSWKEDLNKKNIQLTDYDVIEIRHYLSNKFNGLEPPTNLVYDAIIKVAREHSYHPIKNYLNALVWDGVPRLSSWLIKYAGAKDNVYIREVSKKMLVAAVARIYNPGCKYDNIVVLEGKQGVRKSTLCSILGGEWFSDLTLDLKSKDTIEMIQGKWIVEISEMGVMKKTDAQSLKAFLSRAVDRVRLPYGRLSEDFPRSCMFIGTINPTGGGYLKDTTGNRRFWLVETNGRIDTDGVKAIRNQLFAEAIVAFNKGEKLYLENEESLKISRNELEKREISDYFYNDIREYTANKAVVTIEEIAVICLGLSKNLMNPALQDRIATILYQLLFEKRTVNGKVVYILNKNNRDALA